jgi:hypothetical protein
VRFFLAINCWCGLVEQVSLRSLRVLQGTVACLQSVKQEPLLSTGNGARELLSHWRPSDARPRLNGPQRLRLGSSLRDIVLGRMDSEWFVMRVG